jgi:CRISPR-associated protein Cas2
MRRDILVSYDVNTQDAAGRKRLRKVAKFCENYGQRVQYSVFECTVSDVELERLKSRLLHIIDEKQDSLRIYYLHGERSKYLESYGRDNYIDFDEPLIF